MRTNIIYAILVFFLCFAHQAVAQEDYKTKIEELKQQRERIEAQEREALKEEVEFINERQDQGLISAEEAGVLKQSAAEKRARNIEDRVAIIDNQISLLERNEGQVLDNNTDPFPDEEGVEDEDRWDPFWNRDKFPKYDRRTYSEFVIAFGLNNAIIEGESLNDSPYRTGGSKFFEIGWGWRTRVFKNSNFLRFHYGVSFQFNGLKSDNNLYYVVNDQGQTEQQEFPFDLDKSKLRLDNLVFPVHFEFGPSKKIVTDHTVRYSRMNQFRLGVGGYGGFNIGHRQKLKYSDQGEDINEKIKDGLDTNTFVYGLSGYIGVDCILLYVKYDLNEIFNNSVQKQQNISIGLRFDI